MYCIVKNSEKGQNRTQDGTRSNREYILNESEGDLNGRLSVHQGSAAPFGGLGPWSRENALAQKPERVHPNDTNKSKKVHRWGSTASLRNSKSERLSG